MPEPGRGHPEPVAAPEPVAIPEPRSRTAPLRARGPHARRRIPSRRRPLRASAPSAEPPRPHLDSRPDLSPSRCDARPPPEPGHPAPAAPAEPEPRARAGRVLRGAVPEPEPEPRADAAGWSARGVSLFRAGRLDHGPATPSTRRSPRKGGTPRTGPTGRASSSASPAPKRVWPVTPARSSLDPRLASSWFNKATIEKALGRPAEAARSLLELLALDPPPDARLVDQGRSLLAEIEGQGVLPSPRGALGFLRAGLQEAEAGRLEEAAAAFESALTDDPLLPGAWLFRGDALAHLGRDAEAAQAYAGRADRGPW